MTEIGPDDERNYEAAKAYYDLPPEERTYEEATSRFGKKFPQWRTNDIRRWALKWELGRGVDVRVVTPLEQEERSAHRRGDLEIALREKFPHLQYAIVLDVRPERRSLAIHSKRETKVETPLTYTDANRRQLDNTTHNILGNTAARVLALIVRRDVIGCGGGRAIRAVANKTKFSGANKPTTVVALTGLLGKRSDDSKSDDPSSLEADYAVGKLAAASDFAVPFRSELAIYKDFNKKNRVRTELPHLPDQRRVATISLSGIGTLADQGSHRLLEYWKCQALQGLEQKLDTLLATRKAVENKVRQELENPTRGAALKFPYHCLMDFCNRLMVVKDILPPDIIDRLKTDFEELERQVNQLNSDLLVPEETYFPELVQRGGVSLAIAGSGYKTGAVLEILNKRWTVEGGGWPALTHLITCDEVATNLLEYCEYSAKWPRKVIPDS